MSRKLIVILGPTASGKSELAVKLAKKFNGVIVLADSRQIYKEMVIGTASPRSERNLYYGASPLQNQKYKPKIKNDKIQKPLIINSIPHYLLHIVEPWQEFNVAIYKKLAIRAIKDIQKRGKLPFLVGGTGLYLQAVVDNIQFPKVPAQKKLREELEKKSARELFEIYKNLDPKGAKFIEKENKRRLIRAIEVCKFTGKPFWQQRKKGKPLFESLQIGIKLSRKELEKKVCSRVNKMIKIGLEKEVKSLIEKYGWIPPLQTIGYQEWSPYLKNEIDKKEVIKKIKIHTLQFAKRQMTWFKRDKRIRWVRNSKEAERLVREFLSN